MNAANRGPRAELRTVLPKLFSDDVLRVRRSQVRRQVEDLIARATGAGATRSDLTMTDLDVVVLALSQVALAPWVTDEERDRFTTFLLDGLLRPSEGAGPRS